MKNRDSFLLGAVAVIIAAVGPVALVVNATSSLQTPSVIRPVFDVASVKSHKPDGGAQRIYTVTYGPEGITFSALSLGFIIGEAYSFPVGRIAFPRLFLEKSL